MNVPSKKMDIIIHFAYYKFFHQNTVYRYVKYKESDINVYKIMFIESEEVMLYFISWCRVYKL